MNLKYKIWLDNEGKAFGEGPYQLLMGVRSCGSLAQAAKDIQMSYSRAHGLMKQLSRKLGFSLIESQAGGVGGGGTHITAQAEDLMRRYEAFMQESAQSLEQIFAKHFPADQDLASVMKPSLTQPKPPAQAKSQPAQEPGPDIPPNLQPLHLLRHDVVALTGGGGKTSIMYALAEQLSAGGAKVLLTTTTKIMLPEHGAVHRLIICADQGILKQLARGIAPGEIVAAGSDMSEGKLLGLSPQLVDELAEADIADYILVEADGAAGKPFKAPAAYEPVIPQSATVVLNIVGIDALDKPLNEQNFHRPAQISAICGLPLEAGLDSKAIAAVMWAENGGRKGLPRGAHWLPVLNKIDDDKDLPAARQIAAALIEKGAAEVVFASTLAQGLKVMLWNKYAQ